MVRLALPRRYGLWSGLSTRPIAPWATVRSMDDVTLAGRRDLPMLSGGAPRERADAARNRIKVLAAAEQLFSARGVAAVSMDDVAASAGVGKGTLYRRFGDK